MPEPTPPEPDSDDPARRFLALLAASLADGSFRRLLLGRPRPGAPASLQRISVRRVALRDGEALSFVWHHATRDETRNLSLDAGQAELRDTLLAGFDHAHLLTAQRDVQLAVGKKGRALLRVGRIHAPPPATQPAHDREKHRLLDLSRPFLAELGVTDAQQRLIPAMARKWKQINKFVEIVDHALAAAGLAAQPALEVLDYGSGKGYLTFAVHDHLQRTLGLAGARVTGVELRADLVGLCNGVVQRLALHGLHFEQGDVRSRAAGAVDVMIALHACDIATDHAIHRGIASGARVILCSPCCHKQLRPQMASPGLLQPLLQHGIHMGQEAEMLTDGLRALLLESKNYATQVFEFVSLEHTSKNKMILAVKRQAPLPAERREQLLRQVGELKRFYGVREQCLETLLCAEPATAAG